MAQGDKKDRGASDSVRAAVDQAFQATAGQAETARTRAQEVVDELAQAAGRVREALDELRPPTGDDLKGIRESLERLEQRVAALEAKQAEAPAPRKPAKKKKSTGAGS